VFGGVQVIELHTVFIGSEPLAFPDVEIKQGTTLPYR
jgi:hypothetical protein